MSKLKTPVSESMVKDDWLTKKEFADELGVSINNLNQILINGPKKKQFPQPGKLYKLPDPTDGTKVRFSPAYVELVKKARGTRAGSMKSKVTHIKSPDLTPVTINVYKSDLQLLDTLGLTESDVKERLKRVFEELANKAKEKIRELKESVQL